MGLSRLNRIVAIFVLIYAIIYGLNYLFDEQRTPCYSVDMKYFGSDISTSIDSEDRSIEPFQIPFNQGQIDDLHRRLENTRFYYPQLIIDNKTVNQSTYGFSHQTAESIRNYFLNKYDWKKTVDELNQYSHFKTRISGLAIHFVRVTHDAPKNSGKEAILFLHGWPGSFLEYIDVARLLNSSSSATYDIIIPSLPGYGYSDAPVRSGMNPMQIARIMQTLMHRLNYSSYIVCGGDWGASIGTFMAQLYPHHVRGLLITMVIPTITWKYCVQMGLARILSPSIVLDKDEQEFLEHHFDPLNHLKFLWTEGGYFHLQATKPDTIGYALNDSPLGLATYILEKWSRWSNTQNDVDQSNNSGLGLFTLDQLLSNVMLYWTTGTITSSMRIYYEFVNAFVSGDHTKIFNGPLATNIPVAVANYRHEVIYIPRTIAQAKYPNIKLWSYHKSGGHFAAIEQPQQYAADVENFLLQFEKN